VGSEGFQGFGRGSEELMMTRTGRAVLDELRVSQGLDPDLPWGGRSPRVLTAAYKRFNLESQGDDANEFADADEALIDEQYRRFRYES